MRYLLLVLLVGCAHTPLPRGQCPSDRPIKGNADSGIYHLPGSLYYGRVRAEACFATEVEARQHGYRPTNAK